MTSIAGIFDNQADAKRAMLELLDKGFNRQNISLIAHDETTQPDLSRHAEMEKDAVTKNTGTCALFGGGAGILIALLTTVGTATRPASGLLAEQPLLAVALGACAGAFISILGNILINTGLNHYKAKRFEYKIRKSRTVVIVNTSDNSASKTARIALLKNYATIKVEGHSQHSYYN